MCLNIKKEECRFCQFGIIDFTYIKHICVRFDDVNDIKHIGSCVSISMPYSKADVNLKKKILTQNYGMNHFMLL